jgi:hypothetical protein
VSCSRRNSWVWRIDATSPAFFSPPSQLRAAIDSDPVSSAAMIARSASAITSSSSENPAARDLIACPSH